MNDVEEPHIPKSSAQKRDVYGVRARPEIRFGLQFASSTIGLGVLETKTQGEFGGEASKTFTIHLLVGDCDGEIDRKAPL